MTRPRFLLVAMLTNFFAAPLSAADLNYSGRSDIWENPFLSFGYNPKTNLVTGYLIALRTAPGRTDECNVVFAGRSGTNDSFSVKYKEEGGLYARHDHSVASISTESRKNIFQFKISKKALAGDCDWIFPFAAGSRMLANGEEITLRMKVPNAGNWVGVYVIKAKRSRFHSQPDNTAVQKTFVVAGDVVYVYEERPDWYFVRYEDGINKTMGWIKKSDTVQP